ncbi:DUF883 family protein [Legionella sp. WA2022007384]
MDMNKGTTEIKNKLNEYSANAQDKAESMTEQVKDSMSDMYQESKKQFNNMEECVEEYADELLQKVKENPLTSLLIAGGIGFIISRLLKK